jgi:type IV secretory pathway TrbD component
MLVLLKVFGVAIVGIGLMKVVLGAKADRLLDPTISKQTFEHPSVDSQVRFYGGAFALYGVLLWMCSNDMARYDSVFRAMMIVFLLAGAARLPGMLVRGKPSIAIMGLTGIELIGPPLLLWWQAAR